MVSLVSKHTIDIDVNRGVMEPVSVSNVDKHNEVRDVLQKNIDGAILDIGMYIHTELIILIVLLNMGMRSYYLYDINIKLLVDSVPIMIYDESMRDLISNIPIEYVDTGNGPTCSAAICSPNEEGKEDLNKISRLSPIFLSTLT